MNRFILFSLGLWLCIVQPHAVFSGELRLAEVFGESMVLPAQRPLKVWGTADAGAEVRVEMGRSVGVGKANELGAWEVTLAPLEASNQPGKLQVTCGAEQLVLDDVLVGQVWLASGQSNMQWSLDQCLAENRNALEEHLGLESTAPIRWCRIDSGAQRQPQEQLASPAVWREASETQRGAMSAVAFFFARRLALELKVPIGIIDTSRGGTPIEPFIAPNAFRGQATLEAIWNLGQADDLAGLKALPGGVFARDENWLPSRLYHSRIHPIRRLAIHGVIWYQGESNSGIDEDPSEYRHKMEALRRGWREAFAQPELPVHYVQLPGSGAGAGWPQLRYEQYVAQQPPHSRMVVTIDLEGAGIHPWNKFDVGERLARCALDSIAAQGLTPESAIDGAVPSDSGVPVATGHGPVWGRVESDETSWWVEIHGEGSIGLGDKSATEPPKLREPDGESAALQVNEEEANEGSAAARQVPGFEVMLSDGRWRAVNAWLEADRIRLDLGAKESLIKVRYAWSPTPSGPWIYDDSQLPASPVELKVNE